MKIGMHMNVCICVYIYIYIYTWGFPKLRDSWRLFWGSLYVWKLPYA